MTTWVRLNLRHLLETNAGQSLNQTWRIGRAAVNRFVADDCLMRANSIAYSVVFSIIPFLAVLVRYADVDKDVIRTYLARFMAAYGMSDATEVLLILNEILDRANAIANVGAVIMIISATNLLSHLEDSFNYIYRATKSRPILYRFSIFVTSLVVLPGVLLVSGGVLRTLTNQLQPPDLLDVARSGDSVWIAGSDGMLRERRDGKLVRRDIASKVSFDADFRDIIFDVDSGKSGHYYNFVGKSGLAIRLERDDLTRIRRVAAYGPRVYALSETGALFFSNDRGASWDYRLFRFQETEVRQAFMEDLHVDATGKLYILATLGTRSLILAGTIEQGFLFSRLDSVFRRIADFPPGSTADEQTGLYLTGNGGFLYSPDYGKAWVYLGTLYGNRSLQINTITPHPQEGLVLGGSAQSLWRVGRSPEVYANLRGNGRARIEGVHWQPNDHVFAYGTQEFFRFSTDGGKRWHKPKSSLLNSVDFADHLVLEDGTYLFVGEDETVAHLKEPALLEERDAQGYELFQMEIIKLQRYPWLKSLFLQFVLFSMFFSVVLAVFVLGYRILPNAPVDWKPALVGGALSATALVVFVLGFRLWLVTFSSTTVIIYGVWAVVPVGMLLILISTQIVLFGLELAFVMQHPYLYEKEPDRKASEDPSDYMLWNCLLLTSLVYSSMYKQRRPLNDSNALGHFDNNLEALTDARERLVKHGLFAYDSALGEYYPNRPPTAILVSEVESVALRDVIGVPPYARSGALGKRFSEISRALNNHLKESGGTATVADLLELIGRSRK